MTTKAARRFDPAAWIKGKKIPHGPKCEACSKLEVRDALRAIMAAMARGEGRASVAMLREVMAKEYGYKGARPALGEHLRNHERELWREAQAGG